MLNEEGDNVDLYIPRKCSWTNRILRRDDRGAVQINVGHVDAKTGMYTGELRLPSSVGVGACNERAGM